MIKSFASVSGFTLLSRLTGFLRDIVIASLLGSSFLADTYFVAQRLPNHFRAIFGEGAFNSAFVPSYALVLTGKGLDAALVFAGRVLSLLTLVLVPLSLLAMWQMPLVIDLLAPGFSSDPVKFALAVDLTRITFPYLVFISVVTLLSGLLNAQERFAAAAAAPILLNLSIIAALAVATWFPTAAHAAAWGIAVSGVLQLGLVVADAKVGRCLPRFRAPTLDPAIKGFFKTLGPAVIGSAGVQIAIFADTIIASLLPTGSVSSISYADRLYQLPVGMIGIAAGTVLLPAMSRHLAGATPQAAYAVQNRTIGLTLALTAPFLVAFLMIPEEMMRGVFMRGHFTADDASASAKVLAAYGLGILPIVLIRSLVASFYARQDTTTPLIAAFCGIAVNVALKLALYRDHGAPGLAIATAIGAWINGALLTGLALKRGWMKPDTMLGRTILAVTGATAMLALATLWLKSLIPDITQSLVTLRAVVDISLLGISGAIVYGVALFILMTTLDIRLRRS